MRCPILPLPLLCLGIIFPAAVAAQRHNGLSSPPTAPPQKAVAGASAIVPVSSGLGALQFASVNYGVPAPQALSRQITADDDRIRSAALAAIGAPGEYLGRGHIPFPHSLSLDFIALGMGTDLDAILTVELDQHIVSSVLVPEGDSWHRVATILYAVPFNDTANVPATFVRTARSLLQHERYRAVYRATSNGTNGDFTENEAHLRILANRADILISFVSAARQCNNAKRPGCDLTRRWLQPDPADPTQRALLVTATGHLSPRDAADPLASAPLFQQTHLRTFTCQPFAYSDVTQHYEPTANAGACPGSLGEAPHAPTPAPPAPTPHNDPVKPASPPVLSPAPHTESPKPQTAANPTH
jgi:hypothetical protein